jgi:protease secretion system outer membrane protein
MNRQGVFGRPGFAWVAAVICAAALLPAVHAMDLRQAYEAALVNDATLRAVRAATDAQRERLPQARAQLYPNVVLGISRNSNDLDRTQTDLLGRPQQTQDRYMSYNQSLTLRQPLFRKPLWVGLKQAGLLVQEAEATLEREQQNLAVRVMGAYLEALLAQDQLELVRVQLRTTETQLDAARKAVVAGSGTQTDVYEAEAQLDLVLAQELEAREQLLYTRRQMEVLVDQPVTMLAALDAARMPLQTLTPASLDDWLSLAEASSPELKALRARRDAARLEIDKAQGGHYPTLDVVAQITRSGSENATSPSSKYVNRVVGLQLNVPLFAGGLVNSTVRQATAEWVRADEALEAARRDLGVRVHQEFRGVTEGIPRIRALEQAVRSAEQLVRSNRRSFEAGVRTMIDILNAEQRHKESMLDLARARYMYLISGMRLRALAGQDTVSIIQGVNDWLAFEVR